MSWVVEFHPEFSNEFDALSDVVQDKMLQELLLLKEFGHQLGRPTVDTLCDSQFNNMKELRFDADNGVWRVAFAFDPTRKAILLVAGDKGGANQKKFYKELIKKADKRFSQHLENLSKRL